MLLPGMFYFDNDRHCTNAGGVGALALRVGAEISRVLATGTTWTLVPQTMRIEISGRGSGAEVWADVVVRVPRGRVLELDHGVGEVSASGVEGELAWALAMYVYSLQPPPRATIEPDAVAVRGRALFDRHCAHCHRDADGAGAPVDADTIGTDPVLAFGRARGTGLYRPAPLQRVADAAPYLHHGVVATLDALLGPERLQPDYAGGARGPGPIPGHRYGTSLPADDRRALVAFLGTL